MKMLCLVGYEILYNQSSVVPDVSQSLMVICTGSSVLTSCLVDTSQVTVCRCGCVDGRYSLKQWSSVVLF